MSDTALGEHRDGEDRLSRVTATCIRSLWFVIIPLLLAALTQRYLVPPPSSAHAGLLGELSRIAGVAPVPLFVGLFLFFTLLLRYWGGRLPGAQAWQPAAAEPVPFDLKQAALWGGALLAAVALAVVLRSSLYQSYRVLSASMLPSFEPGAHLLATRFAYGLRPFSSVPTPPRRGDVIVFDSSLGPSVPDQLVKRVIGLPGDTIGMKGGRPVINGWDVPSCAAGRYVFLSAQGMLDATLTLEFLEDRVYLTAQSPASQALTADYLVQPGEVFVLGDNRNNSSDSRAWNAGRGGGLPIATIVGRVDRLLVGVKRNGDADFAQLFQKLALNVHIEGVDTTQLVKGIERCLAQRPQDTSPPRVEQPAAASAP